MDILSTISTTSDTANTIFQISTFDWDKKSVIKLLITGASFIGLVSTITCIDTARNSKPRKKRNPRKK